MTRSKIKGGKLKVIPSNSNDLLVNDTYPKGTSPTRASPTRASPTRASPTRVSPTRASPSPRSSSLTIASPIYTSPSLSTYQNDKYSKDRKYMEDLERLFNDEAIHTNLKNIYDPERSTELIHPSYKSNIVPNISDKIHVISTSIKHLQLKKHDSNDPYECTYGISSRCTDPNATEICTILQQMADNCKISQIQHSSVYSNVLEIVSILIKHSRSKIKKKFIIINDILFTFDDINIAIATVNGQYVGHIFHEGSYSHISNRKFAMFVGIIKAKGDNVATREKVSVANSLIAHVEAKCLELGYKYILTFPLPNMRQTLFNFNFLLYYNQYSQPYGFMFKQIA